MEQSKPQEFYSKLRIELKINSRALFDAWGKEPSCLYYDNIMNKILKKIECDLKYEVTTKSVNAAESEIDATTDKCRKEFQKFINTNADLKVFITYYDFKEGETEEKWINLNFKSIYNNNRKSHLDDKCLIILASYGYEKSHHNINKPADIPNVFLGFEFNEKEEKFIQITYY